MKFKIIIFMSLSILFTLGSSSFAQNYNDAYRLGDQTIDFDARTLGLGNSTIASLGNFSSSLINPAGLATIHKSILNFGINTNSISNSAMLFNSVSSVKKNNNNTNQFSLVLPLPTKRGSAVLAVGYTQTKDFNSSLKFDGYNSRSNSMIQDLTSYNDDIAYDLYLSYPVYDSEDNYLYDATNINGKLNQSGTIDEEGYLNNWIISGAFEISKNIFIGGTFNIISGKYKNNRKYNEDDINNVYTGYLDPTDSNSYGFESFYLNDIVDQDISGWDFRLGLLYNMDNILSFGALIKFPTKYSIDEIYSVHAESYFTNNQYNVDYGDTKSSYDISTPMELSGGISADLPLIKVSAGLKYIDYSQMKFTDGFEAAIRDEKNQAINDVFESVINYNVGAEFTLPYPTMKIRGGFIYNPSPYVGDGSEYDKKYVTVGLGLPLSKNLIIDFAYLHGWWKNFGDNYGYNVSRTYQDLKLNKVAITLNYSFM